MEKIYQVFMGSFAKDFNELTDKLDYIKWMGFNSVLLNPIFKAPSYHKYDTVDYMTIDESFGTLEDFKRFINKCEMLDLDVYMDIVLCHTSSEHPWFKEGRLGNNDYYSFSEELPPKEFWYSTPMHKCSWVKDECGKWYLSPWGAGMPSLNIHSRGLRQEVEKVLSYWLSFSRRINIRLDAILYADLIYAKAVDYCYWIRDIVRNINPDIKIIGEVWDTDEVVNQFANALGSCFSFDDARMMKSCASCDMPYHQKGSSGLVYFLSNHDQSRLKSCLVSDDKVKKAFDMLYSVKGKAIVVYYGDEIGMTGFANGLEHTEVRRKMDWEEVNRQSYDENSLLNHIRKLNRMAF